MNSTSWSAAALRCSGLSRSASSPPWSLGCSVLTRPSMISGKPVKSSIARTARPASLSAVAVPPVETISTPSSASPRAKSTIPRLSETDSSARWMRTAPGAVGASGEVSEAMAPMVFGRCCRGGPGPVRRAAQRGVGSGRAGNAGAMTESRPGEDVAERMERDADELEHHLNKLEDHISDAEKAAQARREEAMPAETVAGDWEETRGAPGQGEDPEGAVGEHSTDDGATERDATEGEDP